MRNVHSAPVTKRGSRNRWAIRAAVNTIETCSEANPAMLWTLPVASASQRTSARSMIRTSWRSDTPVVGRPSNNPGNTKIGPSVGTM